MSGHPLSKALQATLIMPLMAAAAAAGSGSSSSSGSGSAAYPGACVQLLHAVCGCVSKQPQTAAAGPELFNRQQDSSRVSESLALACRLQPHMLAACRAAGEHPCEGQAAHCSATSYCRA